MERFSRDQFKFDSRVYSAILAGAFVFFTIFLYSKLFKPQRYYDQRKDFYKKEEYVKWYVSRISDEYMPPDFIKPKTEGEIPKEKIEIVSGTGTTRLLINKTNRVLSEINLDKPSTVRINLAYFPAWNIYANGKKIEFKNDRRGLVLYLPQGKSIVEARFIETPIEKLADFLSLLGIFLIFLGIIKSYEKKAG
jgi:hypothetical protein